ncbi:hypothetical protein [Peribacillus muralis]|uniref:hypothetical protein n=1 Tax=Peribacillus muralis TaxID=264697 RepID=UPI003CFCEEE6
MKKYMMAILYFVAGAAFLVLGHVDVLKQSKNPELAIGFGYIFLVFGGIHFLIKFVNGKKSPNSADTR